MVYVVDDTGTRQVTRSGLPAGAARSFDPEIELHPADNRVELDLADLA